MYGLHLSPGAVLPHFLNWFSSAAVDGSQLKSCSVPNQVRAPPPQSENCFCSAWFVLDKVKHSKIWTVAGWYGEG